MSRTPGQSVIRKSAVFVVIAAATIGLSACSSEVDVSAEGQIEYACALIEDLKENSPYVSEWGLKIGPEAPVQLLQAMGAASLVGGATGGPVGVSQEMHDGAKDIVAGTSMIKEERIQDGLNTFARECAALQD